MCVCTWSLVHSPTFYQHSIPTIHLYMTVIFNNKSKITNQWHKQKLYLITQCLYIRPAVCIASVSLCIRPDLVWYFTYLYNYYITVSGWRTKMATDFCRAMLCISAACAVICGVCLPSVRLSICVSVTFVDHVKTNKHVVKIFSPSGSHTILVFPYQMGWWYFDGNPRYGGVECRWGRQKLRFWL